MTRKKTPSRSPKRTPQDAAKTLEKLLAKAEAVKVGPATWTHVDKELPTSDIAVLIHCPNMEDPVWIGYHDGIHWRNGDHIILDDDEVTSVEHWMPLPDAP